MKWLLAGGVLVLVVAGALGTALGRVARGDAQPAALEIVGAERSPYTGSEPGGRFPLPEFTLRDYTGELVDSRQLRGKVVVLTFLDSQCEESCPIIANQVARTLERLTPAERKQVEAVAISTDPAEDTPETIRAFLDKQRALGKLRFLDGEEPELRKLWKQFAIYSSLESGHDAMHSAPVRVYDRDSLWVATLHPGADLTPEALAHDIRVALEKP